MARRATGSQQKSEAHQDESTPAYSYGPYQSPAGAKQSRDETTTETKEPEGGKPGKTTWDVVDEHVLSKVNAIYLAALILVGAFTYLVGPCMHSVKSTDQAYLAKLSYLTALWAGGSAVILLSAFVVKVISDKRRT